MIGTLIVLGAMPLGLGWLLNWYMNLHPETFPPMFIIGLAFLLAWGFASWKVNKKLLETGTVLIAQHAIAAIMLVLVTIQLITGNYWVSYLGIASQMFFMPVLYVGAVFFNWAGTFGIYFASFLLMLLASFIGCKIAEK